MICQHIVLLEHINNAVATSADQDKLTITRCPIIPIIPIRDHHQYYSRIDTEVLVELEKQHSPTYLLDSSMCYAELKLIVQNTPAKTCINKFCKTSLFFVLSSLSTMLGSSKTNCPLSSTRGNTRTTTSRHILPVTRKFFSR